MGLGMSFITEMFNLIYHVFMKFWDLQIGDLGFNLGTFFTFTILLRFALSIFSNMIFQPINVKQGFSKVAEKSKSGAKKVAQKIKNKE